MGDDIGLGEVTRRFKAVLELLVERQVDIDLQNGPMADTPMPQAERVPPENSTRVGSL